jgi:hypothetical protein
VGTAGTFGGVTVGTEVGTDVGTMVGTGTAGRVGVGTGSRTVGTGGTAVGTGGNCAHAGAATAIAATPHSIMPRTRKSVLSPLLDTATRSSPNQSARSWRDRRHFALETTRRLG